MCLNPIRLTKKVQRETDVPCGRCPECTQRRASGWSFRLMNELKRVSSAYFITLTYATTHVPITKKGFLSLRKKDVQLFIKRLRKLHPKSHDTIKYYAAGEYGGKTKRPHYHIILFNSKLELIGKAWKMGDIHYGMDVNEASVGYTLKYISKPSRIPEHKNDDRLPEFALMSKLWAQTTSLIRWYVGTTKMYSTVCTVIYPKAKK